MKRGSRFSPVVIRFRRWSRKSYAIACSFKHQVTIGTLRGAVADSLLKRPGQIKPAEFLQAFLLFADSEVCEQCDDPLSENILQQMVPVSIGMSVAPLGDQPSFQYPGSVILTGRMLQNSSLPVFYFPIFSNHDHP